MSKNQVSRLAPICAAIAIPVFYLIFYTPLGMDTTDFGYFYGYAWRILEGQTPYRDFYYIKPALPLYWHAFWMWMTPEKWQILAGKAGFLCEMLAASWLTAFFLNRFFDPAKLKLPVTLLATTGFIYSVHTFPHMPWHTADGAFFCALSLFCAAYGWVFTGGLSIGCAILCKQSFALAPFGILFLLWFWKPLSECIKYFVGVLVGPGLALLWLWHQGALGSFFEQTTGQLHIWEAIDAGILIYVRQNWWLPALAVVPWAIAKLLKKDIASWLTPPWLYLFGLTLLYVFNVEIQKRWLGFGYSWPTLMMVLGEAFIFLPKYFLVPFTRDDSSFRHPYLLSSAALSAPHIIAWSCAISGGYKTPAFFATSLLFSLFILQGKMTGRSLKIAWGAICAGLIMFGLGYQYPYIFPERPLKRQDLKYDAGQVYEKASGVKVDREMLEKLRELKELRAKYGPKYKTLPGFTLAYYLNKDYPQLSSDWLIDWEINGQVDKVYQELLDKHLTVFMERDQLNAKKADAYDRSGYSVPQRVAANWRIVEETPHFVVFQPPPE